MRKYWYLAVAPAAAALAILANGPAYAANNVITLGSAGGTAAAVGDVVNATLASGTTANFFSTATGSTGARCSTSQFAARINSNPAAPGTATEALTTQTFTNCTANIFGVSRVNGVVVNNLGYNTSVSSSGAVVVSGGTAGPIQTTVSLQTILGAITCVYRTVSGSITGTASNADNSIAFVNQQFTKTSGPNLCFGSAFFTARYSPILDGGVRTFVN
jgi:hypothetical protein